MPMTHVITPELQLAIDAAGIRHSSVDRYALASITGRLQVRDNQTGDGDVTLNSQKVTEYRNKFRSGSVCPPIGITRDGVLIWGNHRVGGALAAEWDTVPAIVFDVDGADPDEHLKAVLVTLSGRENAAHGLALTNRDREIVVRQELALGTSNALIQQVYGLTSAQVSGLRREIEAEKRLLDLHLADRLDGKARAVKRALSGPNAKALTNAPFRALVDLIRDADLSATEVNAIADAAKATRTEDGAIAVVDQHRDEMSERITRLAAHGVVERPSPLGNMRKAVKAVTSLCQRAEASVYRDYTEDAATTLAQIDAAIACLQSIRAAQEV